MYSITCQYHVLVEIISYQGIKQVTVNDMRLYGDTNGNPIYSEGARDLIAFAITTDRRPKRIDSRYHYVRDIAAPKVIEVIPIGTEFMAAVV